MGEARTEMSQAEFARKMEVSRAAVSQWKSTGILDDDAFTQPGKKGKVIYEIAVDQVRRNRDIGQSLGNGIATKTTGSAVSTAEPVPVAVVDETPPAEVDRPPQKQLRVDTIEDQLKQARLEEQKRKNRIAAQEEAMRQGLLMASDDARDQMLRISGMMLQIFEGALPSFAEALADKFAVPQRDALHLLKGEFRKVRKTAAMKERAQASEMSKSAVARIET